MFYAGMRKIPISVSKTLVLSEFDEKNNDVNLSLIQNTPEVVIAFHPDINSSKRTKEILIEAVENDIPAFVVRGSSGTKIRMVKFEHRHDVDT